MVELPQKIVVGDSMTLSVSQQIIGKETYGSDIYALTLLLRGGGKEVDVIGTPNPGNGWDLQMTPAQGAGLAAGSLAWSVVATTSTERVTLGQGLIDVVANLASKGTYDPRTKAKKALDDAENALATFTASGGKVSKYTIGTRQMEFAKVTEILEIISYWKIKVAYENGTNKDRLVRFRNGL